MLFSMKKNLPFDSYTASWKKCSSNNFHVWELYNKHFFHSKLKLCFDEKKTYIEQKTLLTHIQLLKKPFQKISENFINNEKKCLSYNFHIWELYDKHFFIPNWNAVLMKKTNLEQKTLLTHIQLLKKPFQKISKLSKFYK